MGCPLFWTHKIEKPGDFFFLWNDMVVYNMSEVRVPSLEKLATIPLSDERK